MAFGRSLFAVGSSVALVLLFAGPAAANNFSASVTGARANYTDSGDVLTATDTATDGQSARAQVRRKWHHHWICDCLWRVWHLELDQSEHSRECSYSDPCLPDERRSRGGLQRLDQRDLIEGLHVHNVPVIAQGSARPISMPRHVVPSGRTSRGSAKASQICSGTGASPHEEICCSRVNI